MKGLYHRNVLFTKYPRHLKCFENASTSIVLDGFGTFFLKDWIKGQVQTESKTLANGKATEWPSNTKRGD